MKLEIQILAAKQLPRINPKVRQYPYCMVQIDGVEDTFQTQAIKNSTNPEWNETFIFPKVSPKEVVITLSVMHKKQIISDVNFTLTGIDGGEFDDWVNLVAENESQNGGKIRIKINSIKDQFSKEEEEEEEEEDIPEAEDINSHRSNQANEVEEEETNVFMPYSPHRTPDLKRTKERIANDNGDAAAIIDKASKAANQRYIAFLKQRAPNLIDNEKKMEKVRQQMKNDEDEN